MKLKTIIEEIEKFVSRLSNYLDRKSLKTSSRCLKISWERGIIRYYEREQHSRKTKYLPKSDMTEIRRLAQQQYEAEIKKETQFTIDCLGECLKILRKCKDPDAVYDSLPEERKELITKDTPSMVDVEKWRNRGDYIKLGFDKNEKEIVAKNGLRVRSKSEEIIVDIFEELGIPYIYEYMMIIDNQRVYPDFLVLNTRTGKEYVYEHFGRISDESYVNRNMLRKIRLYAKKGIYLGDNLLMTFETAENPLNEMELREYFRKFFL